MKLLYLLEVHSGVNDNDLYLMSPSNDWVLKNPELSMSGTLGNSCVLRLHALTDIWSYLYLFLH